MHSCRENWGLRFGVLGLCVAVAATLVAIAQPIQAQDSAPSVSAPSVSAPSVSEPRDAAASVAKKRRPRLFSTEPAVVPTTDAARKLAASLAAELGKGVTRKSLAKRQKGDFTGLARKKSTFSLAPSVSSGVSSSGKVSIKIGDLFVAFVPTGKVGLLGIINSVVHLPGKSASDNEYRRSLEVLGFEVKGIVDRYQIAFWEKMDPSGIAATIARQPDVLTAALSPAVATKLLLPNSEELLGVGRSASKGGAGSSVAAVAALSAATSTLATSATAPPTFTSPCSSDACCQALHPGPARSLYCPGQGTLANIDPSGVDNCGFGSCYCPLPNKYCGSTDTGGSNRGCCPSASSECHLGTFTQSFVCCAPGEIWNAATRTCACPTNQELWPLPVTDSTSCVPKCTSPLVRKSNGACQCPGDLILLNPTTCGCPYPSMQSGTSCSCPAGMTMTIYGCQCNTAGEIYSDGACRPSPASITCPRSSNPDDMPFSKKCDGLPSEDIGWCCLDSTICLPEIRGCKCPPGTVTNFEPPSCVALPPCPGGYHYNSDNKCVDANGCEAGRSICTKTGSSPAVSLCCLNTSTCNPDPANFGCYTCTPPETYSTTTHTCVRPLNCAPGSSVCSTGDPATAICCPNSPNAICEPNPSIGSGPKCYAPCTPPKIYDYALHGCVTPITIPTPTPTTPTTPVGTPPTGSGA